MTQLCSILFCQIVLRLKTDPFEMGDSCYSCCRLNNATKATRDSCFPDDFCPLEQQSWTDAYSGRTHTSQVRARAKREPLDRFEGLLPESQGRNLALTVLHVPCLLDSFCPLAQQSWTDSCSGLEGYYQPAESDRIVFSNPLDLNRSSPESDDLQCRPGVSKTTICSHSQGWW